MSSIFGKIIAGEIPSYKVAENGDFLAFLDAFPIVKGHTLVIPKKVNTDKLFELERGIYNGLMDYTYTVAKGIEKVIPCNRVGVAVLGLEVPHAHVHLVPITAETDLSFAKPKLQLSTEEFEEIRAKIASVL